MENFFSGAVVVFASIVTITGCSSTQPLFSSNIKNQSASATVRVGAGDKLLALNMPEESLDGSFVIKLTANDSVADGASGQVELWRNYNGSPFKLVSTQPVFKAISQSVSKEGIYGYRARLKSGITAETMDRRLSHTSYINVKLRFPEISGLSVKEAPQQQQSSSAQYVVSK